MQTLNNIKNVIFLGRKPLASEAVEYLLTKGIKIKLIVADENDNYKIKLKDTAEKFNIPIFYDDSIIYQMIDKQDELVTDIDLIISYLFPKRIKYPLINLAKRGCINFHPAPLPDYKSRAGYNTAILDQRKDFGVSAHFIDSEKFDSGPIIKVLKFPIDVNRETAFSIEKKSQIKLLELLQDIIDMLQTQDKIDVYENKGGLYLKKEQLEKLKEIDLNKDSLEDINRKIRAFFFPPYAGAKIKIKGQDFTLINDDILDYIYKLMNNSD